MKNFSTKGRQTIWVSFLHNPDVFEVYRDGRLYFFRILDGKYSTIKFNVCHPGNYTTNTPLTNIQILPLSIHPLKYKLPPHEREKIKPYKVVRNYELTNTPARNFVEKGIIETGAAFEKLPQPLQRFIILHEEGH